MRVHTFYGWFSRRCRVRRGQERVCGGEGALCKMKRSKWHVFYHERGYSIQYIVFSVAEAQHRHHRLFKHQWFICRASTFSLQHTLFVSLVPYVYYWICCWLSSSNDNRYVAMLKLSAASAVAIHWTNNRFPISTHTNSNSPTRATTSTLFICPLLNEQKNKKRGAQRTSSNGKKYEKTKLFSQFKRTIGTKFTVGITFFAVSLTLPAAIVHTRKHRSRRQTHPVRIDDGSDKSPQIRIIIYLRNEGEKRDRESERDNGGREAIKSEC